MKKKTYHITSMVKCKHACSTTYNFTYKVYIQLTQIQKKIAHDFFLALLKVCQDPLQQQTGFCKYLHASKNCLSSPCHSPNFLLYIFSTLTNVGGQILTQINIIHLEFVCKYILKKIILIYVINIMQHCTIFII